MNDKTEEYHRPTILQVVPSLIAGGVERGTIDIAKAIVGNTGRAIVLSRGGALVSQLLDAGAKHISINVDTKNPLFMLLNIHRISEIIKKEQVDIIHARSRAPAWSSYFAAKNTDCPFITTFHGIYNFTDSCKRQYNSIMTWGHRVIAVSNFVKHHILDNYDTDESKIRVIHRGVDTKYFDPAALSKDSLELFRKKYHIPQSPVILLPARMTRWKGHECLVKALNTIKNKDFYCIIAGDLSKHPGFTYEIKKMIQEFKLQGRIQIFGPEADMMTLYGISDIVLSTSIAPEAFGRVAIEGQAMEKVVIASNIGGSAETIIDEVNGYHFTPNDPQELGAKIAFVLDNLNTKKLDTLRKTARKSSQKNFSLETMQQKTLDVYKEVL